MFIKPLCHRSGFLQADLQKTAYRAQSWRAIRAIHPDNVLIFCKPRFILIGEDAP